MAVAVLQTSGGFRFTCDDQYQIERHILANGEWEGHLRPLLDYFIKPGFVCVDAGANSGFHTLGMAQRVGSEGRVFAFEPSKRTLQRLKANVALNPELESRIQIFNLGLAHVRENQWVCPVGNEGNAYLSRRVEPTPSGSVELQPEECLVDCLDALIPEGRVDFIKIDVEGMELEVLQGAVQTFKRCRPIVIYETLLEYFSHEKIRAVERWFDDHQYRLVNLLPKVGKLTPVRYPNYNMPDTVAFPTERTLDFAEVLCAAATYSLMDSTGNRAGQMVLCSAKAGELYARISLPDLAGDFCGQFASIESCHLQLASNAGPAASMTITQGQFREGRLQFGNRLPYIFQLVSGAISLESLWL